MYIGIAGKKHSGKDTLCKILLDMLGDGWERHAFADAMKDCLEPFCNILGWSRESFDDNSVKESIDQRWGFSRRKVMQAFGTEFGRSLDDDLWVKLFHEKYKSKHIIIPDVRFDNEADLCRENGILIHIQRDTYQNDSHESENDVLINLSDYIIYNIGTITDLEDNATILINDFWY